MNKDNFQFAVPQDLPFRTPIEVCYEAGRWEKGVLLAVLPHGDALCTQSFTNVHDGEWYRVTKDHWRLPEETK